MKWLIIFLISSFAYAEPTVSILQGEDKNHMIIEIDYDGCITSYQIETKEKLSDKLADQMLDLAEERCKK